MTKIVAQMTDPNLLAWNNAPTIRSANEVPPLSTESIDIKFKYFEEVKETNAKFEWLLAVANGKEIWRGPLFWEGYDGVIKLITALREAYDSHLHSLSTTRGVRSVSLGTYSSAIPLWEKAIADANPPCSQVSIQ